MYYIIMYADCQYYENTVCEEVLCNILTYGVLFSKAQ